MKHLCFCKLNLIKTFLICLLLLPSISICGQNSGALQEVRGRIINKETREPLPYVSIMSYHSRKGTISDLQGYFKISTNGSSDSLLVSCIGFKKQVVRISDKKDWYPISLDPSIQLLNEVVIRPTDNSYLFDLLLDCRKKAGKDTKTAKAYYELKSYVSGQQIELIEAFFNAETQAYDLKELDLKAGRFALKNSGNRFFMSRESSRAIILNALFAESDLFPESPLSMTKSIMKKRFWLELEKKYLDNNKDSVYVIRYMPRDTSGLHFQGRIWLNPNKKYLLKTTFECSNCKRSPFMPLFSLDNLSSIGIFITRTYKEIDAKMFINHTDFTYSFNYESRTGKSNQTHYSLLTNAVIHIFDYDNTFLLPVFEFDPACVRDYEKINAMPYNQFFWDYNDEFQMIDHDNRNSQFYEENEEFSNKNWYKANPAFIKVYEKPFITWSEKRVLIKDVSNETSAQIPSSSGLIANKYKLGIKIFMDINTYSDSTNVITSSVFDPWETFYNLPVDSATNCFLNIIFDIYEIERRHFVKSLPVNGNNTSEILRAHAALTEKLNSMQQRYLSEVDRGTRIKELKKWNQIVIDNLGINNMDLFNLL